MTYLYDKSGIYFFQSGASPIVAREILLFELMNDYNFVQNLENNLVRTSLNSINDLQLAFEFSYEDRCKVLRCATPCQAFFENLSKSKPRLSLQYIKDEVEMSRHEDTNTSIKPNMSIFMNIEKDIRNGSVSFTLASTLGELSDNAKDWLYISENVVANLVPLRGTLLISWENIASKCGYTAGNITTFKQRNTNPDESPLQKILHLLLAREPLLHVSVFVDKLRQIKREDIANMVEEWQCSFIVSLDFFTSIMYT